MVRVRVGDAGLAAAGWEVQNYKHAAVATAPGVAVREAPTEAGPADYVMFVDGQAVGVIEAKKEGTSLTGDGRHTEDLPPPREIAREMLEGLQST